MRNVSSTSLPVLLSILRAGKVSPLVKSPLIKAPQNLHFIDIIVIFLYDDAPASSGFAYDIDNNNTAKAKFFEDGTGVITDGISLRAQFDYNLTEGGEEGLNYTKHGILFPHGTRLI
jgi:hypothetical protein